MTTLVTGAPGWLGTRLAKRLVEQGESTCCLVQPGTDPAPIQDLSVELRSGDLRDREAVRTACRGVDTVVHCAGVVHAQRFRDFREINLEGTRNLLEAARSAGVSRFVHVSSSAAQGYNRDGRALTEEAPCFPNSEYGRTKRVAEQVVLSAHGDSGLEVVVLRPPMFYGPDQPALRSRLMRVVATGRPPLFGDGLKRRSMVHIDNFVDALLLARSAPGACGEIFWIADARPYTTLEVLECIAGVLGVTIRPVRLPTLVAAICGLAASALERCHLHLASLHVVEESTRDFYCDIGKARGRLAFDPRRDLVEGMRAAAGLWLAREPRFAVRP